MTTIPQLFDAIQQINAGVKGIKYTPSSANVPAQLTSDKLPAAVTWYAMDDWTKFGDMHFVVEVYVAPTGQSSPTTAMLQCLTLADAFRSTYKPLSKILGIPIAREKRSGAYGFGADGVHKTLGFGGIEYFGFSFRVPLMGSNL